MASQTELLILFGSNRRRLTRFGVKEVVSRVNDRILEICEPNPLCTPPQSTCQHDIKVAQTNAKNDSQVDRTPLRLGR